MSKKVVQTAGREQLGDFAPMFAHAKFKYDATAAQDNEIIFRVVEIAEKQGVTMTEVSFAWLLT